MSVPESQPPISQLELLSAEIDQHAHQSNPQHEVEAYFRIIKMGESALGGLLAAGEQMGQWRMQAVIEIADNIERPIDLPPYGSTYVEFLDALLMWGRQNGYVPDDPAGND